MRCVSRVLGLLCSYCLLGLVRPQRNFCDVPATVLQDTSVFKKEYDFIIVGSGSGGSVLANRLTEIPDWKVLLLEAGRDETCFTDIPLASPIWSLSSINWGYKTVPQANVCLAMNEERCLWPRGKTIGGTSVINFMVYTRGNQKDYDQWREAGNEGWGWNDVEPYFVKLEGTRIPELKTSTYRGQKGPVSITRVPFETPLAKAYLSAGASLGYDVNDSNGPKQIGFDYVQATMKNGRRFSAAKAYLRPVKSRPNLFIAKQARVTRVLIDPETKKAFGVEFVKNRKTYRVNVTKEVLVCSGTLNSPQVLMLSGVGPKQHLTNLKIPVIQDLAVGDNLQDHVAFPGVMMLVNDSVTVSERTFAQNPLGVAFDFLLRDKGPLSLPGGTEALAFVNTRGNITETFPYDEDVPDIELVMGPGIPNGLMGGLMMGALGVKYPLADAWVEGVRNRDGYLIVPIVLKPKSRGSVRLRSKNPFHSPLFEPGYYSDESDLRTLVRGIRAAIKISEAPSLQKYGSTLYTKPFPSCVQHEFGSDEYWMCAARHLTTNLHHQSGTCKMGPPEDPTSVVDPSLRVIGVQGLRVVDASIMPVLPAAHTNGPVFMIAEKAADMIKDTWKTT